MIRALTPLLLGVAAGVVCPLCSQTTGQRLQSLTEKAQAAQKSGDFEAARAAYAEILEIRPHWGPAEFNLGLMYHLQKRFPEAIRFLTESLEHDPSLAPAFLFRGIAYFNTGQYEKALASLRQYLKRRPQDPEVHFFLGGTYYALGDYPNAALHYVAQLKLGSEREDLYYRLGECYLALARAMLEKLAGNPGGKYFLWLISAEGHAERNEGATAESLIREALKIDAGAPEAYVSLGQLLLGRGDPAAGRSNFREALRRKADDCRALAGLADAEMALGNTSASREMLEQVMRLWPACLVDPPQKNPGALPGEIGLRLESSLARANGESCEPAIRGQSLPVAERELARAGCLESRRAFDGATQALQAAVSAWPRDPRVEYWAFRIYMRLSQRCIAKLMSVSPGSHLLAMMEAQVLDQRGNDGEAARQYQRAVDLRGDDPEPLIEYARFQCKQNQFSDAVPLLQQAVKTDPYNVRANALLGEVYAGMNQPEAAIAPLRLAIEAAPQDEQSRIYLANSLAKLERVKEAIAALETAPSDLDGRIHYVLGTLYRREGRAEDARRALQIFEQRRKGSSKAPAVPRE